MKTIEQTVTFRASPHNVYEALMDSKKHRKFTGSPARISRNVGGASARSAAGFSTVICNR